MSNKVQSEVTQRIIEALRNGVVPWRRPWKDGKGFGAMPRNAQSGRAYSGVNILLLWDAMDRKGYGKPMFLTYKQAQALGGNVRKGENGTRIVFMSFFEKNNDKTGKLERLPFLKFFTVFNVDQCEGITFADSASAPVTVEARNDLVDSFIATSGAEIRHGGNRAYYTSAHDYIMLPEFANFVSADSYYSTAFHELTHWTGSEKRCNRQFGKRFGDNAYQIEELVAELGASFLNAEFGVENEEQSAAYIQSWIKLLTDHEGAIIAAASAASKAVEFLRNKALTEDSEADEAREAA